MKINDHRERSGNGDISMVLLWVNAFIGLLLGAVGTEIIHTYNPKLVKKIEKSAKDMVDSFYSSNSVSDSQSEEWQQVLDLWWEEYVGKQSHSVD